MTELKVTCDRCSEVVIVVSTSFTELRSGASRRRRVIDLCRECEKEFVVWIGRDQDVSEFEADSQET